MTCTLPGPKRGRVTTEWPFSGNTGNKKKSGSLYKTQRKVEATII